MLELKQISKRFGDKQILSDFNLLVPEKQIVAIVGPSGGGKTTLLRMLAGLETIDSGQIIYNGENLPLDALEKRNLLGFVFQDFQLFPHLSVMENLILSPIKTMNVTKEEASKKSHELTGAFGTRTTCGCLSILSIWWSEATGGIGSCYDDRSRNYWL